MARELSAAAWSEACAVRYSQKRCEVAGSSSSNCRGVRKAPYLKWAHDQDEGSSRPVTALCSGLFKRAEGVLRGQITEHEDGIGADLGYSTVRHAGAMRCEESRKPHVDLIGNAATSVSGEA